MTFSDAGSTPAASTIKLLLIKSDRDVAKAMHSAGLISTTWTDGPPMGSVPWLQCCRRLARRQLKNTPLSQHPLMMEAAHYNEVDCKVMSEIISWLRANR